MSSVRGRRKKTLRAGSGCHGNSLDLSVDLGLCCHMKQEKRILFSFTKQGTLHETHLNFCLNFLDSFQDLEDKWLSPPLPPAPVCFDHYWQPGVWLDMTTLLLGSSSVHSRKITMAPRKVTIPSLSDICRHPLLPTGWWALTVCWA